MAALIKKLKKSTKVGDRWFVYASDKSRDNYGILYEILIVDLVDDLVGYKWISHPEGASDMARFLPWPGMVGNYPPMAVAKAK